MRTYYLENIPESAPIFHQPFWLDVVAPGWDVVCVRNDQDLLAVMPFWKVDNQLRMPPLTQFLGPHILQKNQLSVTDELKLLTELREQLPVFDRFEQRWQYGYDNWLPFYWEGFKQTTKYTYVLNNLLDESSLWEQLIDPKKRQIKKARKNKVQITKDLGFEVFYTLVEGTFAKQGMKMPYSFELLKSITNACIQNEQGVILYAVSEDGIPLAASFLVWDSWSTYYIVSGIDDNYKKLGGSSLLMWESIMLAASKTPLFDFEGSMIQGVERYFRSFGAQQKTYFEVSKIASRNLKIKAALSELKRALKNG